MLAGLLFPPAPHPLLHLDAHLRRHHASPTLASASCVCFPAIFTGRVRDRDAGMTPLLRLYVTYVYAFTYTYIHVYMYTHM